MKNLIFLSSILFIISSLANANESAEFKENLVKCIKTYDLAGEARVVVKYKTCLPRFLLINRHPQIGNYKEFHYDVAPFPILDESRFQFSNEVMHISEYLPQLYEQLAKGPPSDTRGYCSLMEALVYQLASNKNYNGDEVRARQDILRLLNSKEEETN